MTEENISLEIILKNIDETMNYFIEEIKQNELMSKKHKNICTTLNFIEHLTYFNFCTYWMCFNYFFCFFSCCSYRNYEFCSGN